MNVQSLYSAAARPSSFDKNIPSEYTIVWINTIWGNTMTARANRKRINKRDIFIRIVSIFLALLIVGGTLITIIL